MKIGLTNPKTDTIPTHTLILILVFGPKNIDLEVDATKRMMKPKKATTKTKEKCKNG